MLGELVLVEHEGAWLPGALLWEYVEAGRHRALIRYETPEGVIVRRLLWRDELWSVGVVLELRMWLVAEDQDDQQSPRRAGSSLA